MGITFSAEDFDNLEGGDLPTPGVVDGDGAPKAPAAPAAPPEPFKYGDDAPEALRGKTAAEAATLFEAMRSTAKTAFEQLQQSHAAAPAPAAIVTKPEDYELDAEDLIGTDPSKVNAKLNKLFETKAGPLVGEILQNQSQQMYTIMRTHPNLPYFQRYEQEILAAAEKMPVTATAKADTWQLLYQTSVASHLPEIIQEQKQAWERERAAPPPTERGRGGPPGGARRVLSDEQRQAARALNVSEEEYAKYVPWED